MDGEDCARSPQKNVFGDPLIGCSVAPMTGFTAMDAVTQGLRIGLHTVCARMDEAFLDFSKAQGNDLSTPRPEFGFPGLKAGDFWCLCAGRWDEARQAGFAPQLKLAATNQVTLALIPLSVLESYAIDKFA